MADTCGSGSNVRFSLVDSRAHLERLVDSTCDEKMSVVIRLGIDYVAEKEVDDNRVCNVW